jgi:flagellar hook-associated protein 1 FlgK
MSYGLLNLGIQGLRSNQTALSVTGQNVANVNTAGYSRQRPEFASHENLNGVEVYDISRVADQFLNSQIWSDTASYNNADIFSTYANELDNLLASDATSLSNAMDNYFGALQTAVDDPMSLPNRELFVAEADALVRRFNDMDANLERQNQSLNGRLESSTAQVNAIARNIAQLNDTLRIATAAGSEVNELLDKRDAQLDQLAQFVNFTTIETPNTGEISVYIGKGEPLVIGKDANELVPSVDPADPNKVNVSLRIGNSTADITDQIKGGQIGGLLEYRDNILDTTRDQIGIITLAFADSMNKQHQLGADLDGELGGLLFSDINSPAAMQNRVLSDGRNVVNVNARVRIEDTTELKASEYKLVFNSESSFTLIRESDGKRWESAQLQVPDQLEMSTGSMKLSVEGFELTMSTSSGGPFASGDQFVLRPARTAASDISMVLKDPRDLALASPLRIETEAGNQGTGAATVTATDRAGLESVIDGNSLNPPIRIEFSQDAGGQLTYRVYNVSNPAEPKEIDLFNPDANPVVTPIKAKEYVSGQPLDLPSSFGYEVVVKNTPKAGDSFNVNFNKDGVSDNRNALAMSDLQFAKKVDNASYQDRYGQLIERVGTQTAVAQINAQASKSVLDANLQARSSLSGVNLDEEAAKLIQFQQAYQASAQVIRASQTIFDALIAAV